ncbi:hypothetical protein ACFE04_000837 [Oxalis oulophora]
MAVSNNDDKINKISCQPLIPGLPDEIAEHCLLFLPYPYPALLRAVSSSWNRVLKNSEFLLRKKLQPHFFVFASKITKKQVQTQWQALDPRSGRWFVLPTMPCPQRMIPWSFGCTSLQHPGKLFVLGGLAPDGYAMDSTVVYRTSTNQWYTAAPMSSPRFFMAAGNVDGKILAAGGNTFEVECYDPEKDTWTAVSFSPSNLFRYTAVTTGSKMYIIESHLMNFRGYLNGNVFDAGKGTWHRMSDGMKKGWTGICVTVRERLFMISKKDNELTVKVYDPFEDAWHFVGGDNFPFDAIYTQWSFSASGFEGKIIVILNGLNVAIGEVLESLNGEFHVQWKAVPGPKAFQDFDPINCQLKAIPGPKAYQDFEPISCQVLYAWF